MCIIGLNYVNWHSNRIKHGQFRFDSFIEPSDNRVSSSKKYVRKQSLSVVGRDSCVSQTFAEVFRWTTKAIKHVLENLSDTLTFKTYNRRLEENFCTSVAIGPKPQLEILSSRHFLGAVKKKLEFWVQIGYLVLKFT